MNQALHIGPDRHLLLETAEAVTKEEVQAAWELAYDELRTALRARSNGSRLYLVFGLQGAGKSTWIRHRMLSDESSSIYFDGPLPSRAKRSRALTMAKEAGIPAVAVWLNVPIEVAISRNAGRRGLALIKNEAIYHVHSLLEPPAFDEGFAEIIEVTASAELRSART